MNCRGGTRDIHASLTLLSRALAAALLASVSLAASSEASVIGLQFGSAQPGTNTAMTLHIRYTKSGDPNAKPSPIRHIQIDAPAGTVFHTSTVPACHASDPEVMAAGPSACPSASRIGGGTVTVITGFGQPFDPFASPTPVFNDGRGWLEISQDPSSQITIAITRLTVTGSRISGDIAEAPGGPPDNQSAVSTVDLSFPASTGYITTPPTCPVSGRWVTTGTFTFADGTTQIVQGETPCGVTATGHHAVTDRGAGSACTERALPKPGRSGRYSRWILIVFVRKVVRNGRIKLELRFSHRAGVTIVADPSGRRGPRRIGPQSVRSCQTYTATLPRGTGWVSILASAGGTELRRMRY